MKVVPSQEGGGQRSYRGSGMKNGHSKDRVGSWYVSEYNRSFDGVGNAGDCRTKSNIQPFAPLTMLILCEMTSKESCRAHSRRCQ